MRVTGAIWNKKNCVVPVAAVLLAGCVADGHQSTVGAGALGALMGGMAGGALSGGDTGSIIAGALVGGLAGSLLGAELDRQEREAMARATAQAGSARVGERIAWTAPPSQESGRNTTTTGWVEPVSEPYTENGRVRRDVQQVVSSEGAPVSQTVTIEQTPEGWRLP